MATQDQARDFATRIRKVTKARGVLVWIDDGSDVRCVWTDAEPGSMLTEVTKAIARETATVIVEDERKPS